ncbi:zinc finger protein 1 homolog [Trichogramma pretiosum]|uniref:zinc finger protein 1 homolog n=1 Tax=Trichogramma pretiosum TaxID=7493 RepID=UPI0006C971A2|nr:zinc finger protein 1 homolog [Trichogramma pretiosum]
MESSGDIVRVKEEPNDDWPDAGGDDNLDSVDFCEVKNVGTLSFHELPSNHTHQTMALQKKIEEKIFVDIECKDFKPELQFPLASIYKTEHQIYPPSVKVENQIQNNNSNDKNLIILIKKEFNYDDKCQFQEKFRLKFDEFEDVNISKKKDQAKLSIKKNFNRKTYKEEAILETNIGATDEGIKRYKCEICHKLFDCHWFLERHVMTVHSRSKLFECNICHKSYSRKDALNTHIIVVHGHKKAFDCYICHKSFGYNSHLKTHIITVHNRSKPFECGICRHSFGLKSNLKVHINTIHSGRKLECDICHKSFGRKQQVKTHINTVPSKLTSMQCMIVRNNLIVRFAISYSPVNIASKLT